MESCGLIPHSFVNLCQPLWGVQRTRDGGWTTGQTPALEELDRPQEAEGKTPRLKPMRVLDVHNIDYGKHSHILPFGI